MSKEQRLVQDAIRLQGKQAQQRLRIQNSSAMDDAIQKFWKLMQRESLKVDHASPPDAVTRSGYEAVYVRINNVVGPRVITRTYSNT